MNGRAMTTPSHRQQGISLIELMISLTIGLLILAGVTTIFATNSKARQEVEKMSRQVENGRYAMQVLSEDLAAAGFLGEFDPTPLALPAALPDPCASDVASLRAALRLHIQGYDGGAVLGCLSDVKAGTDILVVRRASTCVAGSANCDAIVSGTPQFQASLCSPTSGGTELANSPTSDADYAAHHYALDTAAGNMTRHRQNCTTVADIRRYLTHIYFIANNSTGSDGIPTLKRAELDVGGFSIVPLVEGIENLQLEYGIDGDANGTPDSYTTAPATVAAWNNAMTVKINLLARNNDETKGYTDSKTYVLGLQADGSENSVGPFADGYKRHVFSSVVLLANPAGRRQ